MEIKPQQMEYNGIKQQTYEDLALITCRLPLTSIERKNIPILGFVHTMHVDLWILNMFVLHQSHAADAQMLEQDHEQLTSPIS